MTTNVIKVGLILVPNHTNYGAQLQSFATQHIVESLGCKTEIIQYKSPRFNKKIKFYWGLIPWLIKSGFSSKINKRYRNLDSIHAENHRLRKIASNEFKNKYLKNFHKCTSYDELVNTAHTYNAVLIGSDQLWQPGVAFGNFISMRFVPKGVRKISYATSCGVTTYPKYCYKSSADMWKSFDYLSTREETGKELIKKICGDEINVKVHIDPTYLLTKQDWEENIPVKRMLSEKYILCYLIGNNIEQKNCAKQYAHNKKLKLVSLMSNESVSEIDTTFSDLNIIGAGPEDFINWIRGAECIFTDSFHGLAFSIINEKQFYAFYRHKTGISKTKNSRIDNILALFGLQARLITEIDINWQTHNELPIEYNAVNYIVEKKRNDGIAYLKQALSFL